MKYTTKEKKTIEQAYLNLCSLVGRYTGMEYALDNAVKNARNEYNASTRTEARALVINAFIDGYKRGKSINACDLHGLCEWYVMACIVGAGYKSREGKVSELRDYYRKLRTRTLKLSNESREAHENAGQRFRDKIMGRA